MPHYEWMPFVYKHLKDIKKIYENLGVHSFLACLHSFCTQYCDDEPSLMGMLFGLIGI